MSLTPLSAGSVATSASAVDENTHLLRTERRLFRSLRGGTSSGKSLDGTEQVNTPKQLTTLSLALSLLASIELVKDN